MNKKRCIYVLVVFVYITVPLKADYVEFTDVFGRLTTNADYDVGSQLSLVVVDNQETSYEDITLNLGQNQVAFIFYNNITYDSSIAEIYFDDGIESYKVLGSFVDMISSPGVDMIQGAKPTNPPGYSGFTTTAPFSFDVAKNTEDGINATSEYLAVIYNLASFEGYQKDLDDVISALYDGFIDNGGTSENSLRIALHVRGIGESNLSDTYTMVPIPATILLGLLGLGVGGWKLRKTME